MQLSGPQKNLLIESLMGWNELTLTKALNSLNPSRQLVAIAGAGASRAQIALAVTQDAVDNYYAFELVVAGRAERPNDPHLDTLYTQLTLGESVPDESQVALQRYYRGKGVVYDPQVLRHELERIERCVCRIRYLGPNGWIAGTGFLVGPDVVLTNHHVMKDVIENPALVADVELLFDYAVDAAGVELGGTRKQLAPADWLLDSSPHAATDTQASATPPPTDADELDHALVRLSEPIGNTGGGWGADPRRWIALPVVFPNLVADAPLNIVQHPEADRVKVAIEPVSILQVNASGTRVRHRTPTLGGSSGSPCFDGDWRLVALHHAGDPNFDRLALYNQAIPIKALIDRMTRIGKSNLIGSP